jgi:hypothetical protein
VNRYRHTGCSILIVVYVAINLAAAADNVVVPGVRCGAFILGRTKEREVAAMTKAKGLDFQFSKNGILDGVVLTSHDYRTDRGVRVGATEEEVIRAYGEGKTGNIDLAKGTTTNGNPVVIGKIGDKVLFYPGIQVVFARQRVWAIILVPKKA